MTIMLLARNAGQEWLAPLHVRGLLGVARVAERRSMTDGRVAESGGNRGLHPSLVQVTDRSRRLCILSGGRAWN